MVLVNDRLGWLTLSHVCYHAVAAMAGRAIRSLGFASAETRSWLGAVFL
jgi:hypothetical protein